MRRLRCSVQCVDFLAQRRAFQRAAGFALFVGGKRDGHFTAVGERDGRRKHGVRQQHRVQFRLPQPRLAVVLIFEQQADACSLQICTGVKPGARQNWRQRRGLIDVDGGIVAERGKCFAIPLLHHAEATEFTFHAIEVAVVIRVTGDKARPAQRVVDLDAIDDMHRKR